VNKRIWN